MRVSEKQVKMYYEHMGRLGDAEKIDALNEIYQRDINEWNGIYEHGCSDPFWTDGTNLNLVRNRIMCTVEELKSLGVDTSHKYIPPEVDEGLMIAGGPNFERRCKRLSVDTMLKVVHAGDEVPLF